MNWGHRLLRLALAGGSLYAVPHLSRGGAAELHELQEEKTLLLERIGRLEAELLEMERSARALRGGEGEWAEMKRAEEVARIARDDLNMVGEHERVLELHYRGEGQ